ncbi:dicarboxylate/amino acid:cation symporter [bacterium]|nr:dicarboxylate/amino acid:cation symporter [bacterium]
MTLQILIGLGAGAALGLLMNFFGWNQGGLGQTLLTDGVFYIGGQVFLRALQMLVVPIVLISLVCGTAGLGDIKQLGRIGGKTVLLYLMTTAVAVTTGLIVAGIVDPGAGFELTTAATFTATEAPPLVDTLVNIVPKNPMAALAEGEMLQIIFFAILFGLAMTLTGKPGERILAVFTDLNEVVMKLVGMVIRVSPIGVFCLISKVFAEQGFDAILPLAKYFFTILFVLLFHLFITYSAILKFLGKLSPVMFFRKFYEVMVFGFSTASSNATIPVTLEVVEHRLGVKKIISSFTVPLGATINMDGTAIMQGVATVFVAQAYGVDLTMVQYMTVILTATLASIGTAGVPGVGLIMLSMVFQQVGLPIEGIGIIMAVDRLLDMVRTAVNVSGDAAISCVVAKSEGQLDEAIFNEDPLIETV